MFYKLEEKELERIKRVSDITMTDYELENNKISVENLVAAIEDLLIEYDRKCDELRDWQYDVENYYELRSDYDPSNDYGISERDFI